MTDTKYLYNKRYFLASKTFQSETKRLKILADLVESKRPQRVLDVGCGMGYLVNELTRRGLDATGVDFSTAAQEFWGIRKNFLVADAKSLPFADKSFDIVISTDFFEHLPENEVSRVCREMLRVGKTVIAFVADDTHGTPLNKRQMQYHQIHKPFSWWQENLPGIEVHSSHLWE